MKTGGIFVGFKPIKAANTGYPDNCQPAVFTG
jgi:hypothetical protein